MKKDSIAFIPVQIVCANATTEFRTTENQYCDLIGNMAATFSMNQQLIKGPLQ